ncbi:MAG: hypothetical protein KatS3mg085_587 [Candidatus Dojkabacteria bacterium]|nr:MAG: hypothetical protein KatS3mg085_587 [Candidatus Dojkabacteria bacterium]
MKSYNKVLVTVVIFALFFVFALGLLWFINNYSLNNDDELSKNSNSEVIDSEIFTSIDGKSYVAYGPNMENLDLYKKDCSERNGQFVECGSTCELKGGEICTTVCEMLCELP